ncbi:hypothetical protein [Streptomyces sp. NRRL B-24572]|uniref:hypothetical protein n=1 Tax=Streptomyces sp. NRRL B-24572 TaxID=1962156 RepID=UPI000A39EC23|nr:hypothetical protein [Streptomyces sp. NRRL B-24572]
MNRRTALLALASAALMAGCTATPPTTAATHGPTAPDHSGQSLWHVIDGDGKTLTRLADDDPLVTAVRKTVVLHSGVVDNRDHRGIARSAADELDFYNKDFATKLRSQGYGGKLTELFTKNHLTTRQTAIAWYVSTFPRDRSTAKVSMESTIEFTTADPAYLKANDFSLDTPYTQRRTVSLARSGGRWLIVALEKEPLTRQVKTLPGAS